MCLISLQPSYLRQRHTRKCIIIKFEKTRGTQRYKKLFMIEKYGSSILSVQAKKKRHRQDIWRDIIPTLSSRCFALFSLARALSPGSAFQGEEGNQEHKHQRAVHCMSQSTTLQ